MGLCENVDFESGAAILNKYEALVYATRAHNGQRDKSGTEDYILHPIQVAKYVECLGEEFEIVALLHDVYEDCADYVRDHPLTLPLEQSLALLNLTHNQQEPYKDYIERVCQGHLSMYVKLADLHHNLHGRPAIPNEDENKRHRRTEKHIVARNYIWSKLCNTWTPFA